jgi:hypothetical protein
MVLFLFHSIVMGFRRVMLAFSSRPGPDPVLFSAVLLIEINFTPEEAGTMAKPTKGYRKIFGKAMAVLKNVLLFTNRRGKL